MKESAILQLLLHGNQLKSTPRTGWLQRGVVSAEDVAAHSYGVVFTALVLTQVIGPTLESGLDLERILIMATLHDLPEGLTTDIPSPVWKLLPAGIKSDVERNAMLQMMGEWEAAPALMTAWEDLHENTSAEAKLVHDADKLDMFLQAFVYEQQTGNVQLEEFWATPYAFNYPVCQSIYGMLRAQRPSVQDE